MSGFAVVVDVLSFTTTLSVALDVGIQVLPHPWDDPSAAEHARAHDAVLAVGRSQARPGQVSLSPVSLRRADLPPRLVLPSPNGSALAAELGSYGVVVLGAGLRNAAAVARWLCARHEPGSVDVVVVAAGEREPGGLRRAEEDLWGAGAVLAGLAAGGWRLSREAELARAAHQAVRGRERDALLSCASGRELVDKGYGQDVEIAAEVDRSDTVPLLRGDRFVAAGPADGVHAALPRPATTSCCASATDPPGRSTT